MLKRDDFIPQIRILPMDKKGEFNNWSIKEAQQKFFIEDLPYRENGKYRFRNVGMNAERGTLVLFQYDGKAIALAKLNSVAKYSYPEEGIYSGAYFFNVESIYVFEPVGKDEMTEIWPEFKNFSQAKQSLYFGNYPKLFDLLQNKNLRKAI